MELLTKLTSTKIYCENIKESMFVQRVSDSVETVEKVYQDISNLFIDKFDPTCNILEENDKDVYFIQRLLEIATDIDEKNDTNYLKYKYSPKVFKTSVIQSGLQTPNTLSSVIYLGDYYKVTPVIYIDYLQTKVVISKKTRTNIHILYKDGSFAELDEPPDFKQGSYDNLKECFVLNVKKLDVYQLDLQPIGKYKVTELVELANKVNLPIEANGKKKIKSQLYDELNLYYLNKSNSS
jgi:hypothetical protein